MPSLLLPLHHLFFLSFYNGISQSDTGSAPFGFKQLILPKNKAAATRFPHNLGT